MPALRAWPLVPQCPQTTPKTLPGTAIRSKSGLAFELKRQGRFAALRNLAAPALPNEPKQNIVELAFSDSTVDVMLTNDGQAQEQTECRKAGVDERCRTVTRTTNKFGEVESESTSDDKHRSGKSSLLKYINERIGQFCTVEQKPLVVLLDLQASKYHTPNGVIEGIRQ